MSLNKQNLERYTGRLAKKWLMDKGNISKVTTLHMKNFHDKELSKVLGIHATKVFYETVKECDDAEIAIYLKADTVVGFFVYFTNYARFYNRVKFKYLRDIRIVMKILMNLKKVISSNQIYWNITKKVPGDLYKRCLGAIAVDQDVAEKNEIFSNLMMDYREAVSRLGNCWGSCRSENIVAGKILEYNGLIKLSESDENSAICVYIKR